jgi:hypothetical protein
MSMGWLGNGVAGLGLVCPWAGLAMGWAVAGQVGHGLRWPYVGMSMS